jgi:hypothetical protein
LRKDIEMRQLRNAVATLLLGACAPIALVAPTVAQTCACAPSGGGGGYMIQADEPPPPLPDYEQPPIPAPGYYWTPGYWAWNNDDYYWVPGAWVEPPQPGLLWTPGYWAFVGGLYAFRPGYWGQQVGFYGGVDYGYGYGGSGYQGGRWDNGRFFYNTTVNNIGGVHIINVYNQPIVRNATVSRASFNGGPGGVVAAPTAAQSVVDKAQHVPPTSAQRNQARLASVERTQFVSANKGKPAVAATERPGEFKGKGAVPAKAAGQAAEAEPGPTPNAPSETKERPPVVEKPAAPGAQPNAPKAEQKPPATEKLAKPETVPNPPKAEEKRPSAEKLAKPEPAPNPPKPEENRPAAEKPARPEAAQRAIEHPPAPAEHRPAQPERKPEAKECGRPGLPPCPR